MIYSPEEIKERILPILIGRGVKSAVLFGSYSRGEADEESDVDLLVDSGLRGFRFVGFTDEIGNALSKAVDVIDVTHVKPGSRMETEIQNSGVRIYG